MQKESKNILTREGCKAELKRLSKEVLVENSVILAILLLIFVPLFISSIYLTTRILILAIVLALLCVLPPAFFVYAVIRAVMLLRTIEQNGFLIVKDTVSHICRDEIARNYFEGHRTVHAIYFAKYGRCIATKVRSTFGLPCAGDEFYLVILRKNEEIIVAYDLAIYDYREGNDGI